MYLDVRQIFKSLNYSYFVKILPLIQLVLFCSLILLAACTSYINTGGPGKVTKECESWAKELLPEQVSLVVDKRIPQPYVVPKFIFKDGTTASGSWNSYKSIALGSRTGENVNFYYPTDNGAYSYEKQVISANGVILGSDFFAVTTAFDVKSIEDRGDSKVAGSLGGGTEFIGVLVDTKITACKRALS